MCGFFREEAKDLKTHPQTYFSANGKNFKESNPRVKKLKNNIQNQILAHFFDVFVRVHLLKFKETLDSCGQS